MRPRADKVRGFTRHALEVSNAGSTSEIRDLSYGQPARL